MVFFEKTRPAPACLSLEKTKASGTYRCEGVAEQLQIDFKNKCYLCETAAPTSINIEHFKAHKGDRDLMFDWENLFLSCVHCNNTKQALQDIEPILNCTLPEDRVNDLLHHKLDVFPGEHVVIVALEESQQAQNTAELLKAIYNGIGTELKQIESANLRAALQQEVKRFQKLLESYTLIGPSTANEQAKIRDRIQRHLQSDSAFTAFKRWIIRDNPVLMAEFGTSF